MPCTVAASNVRPETSSPTGPRPTTIRCHGGSLATSSLRSPLWRPSPPCPRPRPPASRSSRPASAWTTRRPTSPPAPTATSGSPSRACCPRSAASRPAATSPSTRSRLLQEPGEITAGPDGALWFTERGLTEQIGRIDPADGNITVHVARPRQRPDRDHRRQGRRPLVQHEGHGQDRPHHDRRRGHRVRRPALRRATRSTTSPPAPTASSGSPSSTRCRSAPPASGTSRRSAASTPTTAASSTSTAA